MLTKEVKVSEKPGQDRILCICVKELGFHLLLGVGGSMRSGIRKEGMGINTAGRQVDLVMGHRKFLFDGASAFSVKKRQSAESGSLCRHVCLTLHYRDGVL